MIRYSNCHSGARLYRASSLLFRCIQQIPCRLNRLRMTIPTAFANTAPHRFPNKSYPIRRAMSRFSDDQLDGLHARSFSSADLGSRN